MLAEPPTVAADLAGGVVGLKQHLLLRHLHVQHDGCAGDEQLLRLMVLLEEAEVVGLVDQRLPELGLLLSRHVCVVHTGLTIDEARTHQRGGWRCLILHWGVIGRCLLAGLLACSN